MKKVTDKSKPLTKKGFEKILAKVFVPSVRNPLESDQEGKQTSESHPSDGCSGTHKSQDKTEDKED